MPETCFWIQGSWKPDLLSSNLCSWRSPEETPLPLRWLRLEGTGGNGQRDMESLLVFGCSGKLGGKQKDGEGSQPRSFLPSAPQESIAGGAGLGG